MSFAQHWTYLLPDWQQGIAMSTAQVVTENGRQIVHLPGEVLLEGDEVAVKQIGRSLLLVPRGADRWEMLIASLDQFTDDFMRDRAQPAGHDRDSLAE